MQTVRTHRVINPDRLMDWLMDTVETFHRCNPLGNGICRSNGDSGRVHHNSEGIRVVFADDIAVATVLAAIGSYEEPPA